MAINVGDVKYYHGSGDTYQVRILEIADKELENTPGESYRLKILSVIDTGLKNPPNKGLEFEVWRAKDAREYGGWHILDN